MFCENNFYCKTCFPSFLFENKKLFLKSVTKKTLSTHWIHFLFFIFKIKKMKIKKRVETYLSPQLFLFPQILKFMKVIFKDIKKNYFYIKVSKVHPNHVDRVLTLIFRIVKFIFRVVRVETYLSPQLFLFPQILKFMKVIFKDIRKNCFYIKVSKVYPNQDRAKKFLFYVFKFKKKIVITFYIEKIMVLKYV